MELWQILVALIQGLVEWLPISSEGQAVLFIYNTGAVPVQDIVSVVVWLHLGTALAVVARYPREFFAVLTLRNRPLFKRLVIATAATAVTGVPLYFFLRDAMEAFNGDAVNVLVGLLLIITAVVLYAPTRIGDDERMFAEPDDRRAGVTGLAQGLSMLPGLSRSGITVSTLLMQRVDKKEALRFSFLMSVPAVLGVIVVDLLTAGMALPPVPLIDLILMEAIVFVSGLLSMEALLRLAERVDFWKLCLILGAIAIAFGIPSLLAT